MYVGRLEQFFWNVDRIPNGPDRIPFTQGIMRNTIVIWVLLPAMQ